MLPRVWTGLALALILSAAIVHSMEVSGSGEKPPPLVSERPDPPEGPNAEAAPICSDVKTVVKRALEMPNCTMIFSLLLVKSDTSYPHCQALSLGLRCVAKQLPEVVYVNVCVRKMLDILQADPDLLMQAINETNIALDTSLITVDPRTCGHCPDGQIPSSNPNCGRGGMPCNETVDFCHIAPNDAYAECCPKPETGFYSSSHLPKATTPRNSAPKPETGEDEEICSDVEAVIEGADTSCFLLFVSLTQGNNPKEQCPALKEGLMCIAQKMTAVKNVDACVGKMMMILQEDPRKLLEAIKTTGFLTEEDISKITFNPADCRTMDGSGGGDDDDDDDEDDKEKAKSPSGKPIPGALMMCRNLKAITDAIFGCKMPDSETPTEKACSDLKEMVKCISEKLAPDANDFAMQQCRSAVTELLEKNAKSVNNGKIPKLSMCSERDSICDDGDSPSDTSCKKDSDCGDNFMCRRNFCCPKRKAGVCPPKPKGVPLCVGKRCSKDKDCDDDEKCCEMGCKNKPVCVKLEPKKMGDCRKALEEAGEKLQDAGICLGTNSFALPRCMSNKKFHPEQEILNGNGNSFCADAEGETIEGSEFFGNKDCSKAKPGRPGRCPPSNCTLHDEVAVDVCESEDDNCDEDVHKCCLQRTNSGCVRQCVAPIQGAEPSEKQDDCPNRMCCPVTLCQDAGPCLAHPGAVCRVSSCGECTVEFFNAQGKMVDCNAGVTACQRQRAAARKQNTQDIKSDQEKIRDMLEARRGRGGDDSDEEGAGEMETKHRAVQECGMMLEGAGGGMQGDMGDGMGDDMEGDHEDGGMMRPDSDMGDSAAGEEKKAMTPEEVCKQIDRLGLCKNGAVCALTLADRESSFEICRCQPGFHGLFCQLSYNCTDSEKVQCYMNPCETAPTCTANQDATCQSNYCFGCNALYDLKDGTDVTKMCTPQCVRDRQRTNEIERMMKQLGDIRGAILQRLLMMLHLPNNIIPTYNCSEDGYTPVQTGHMINNRGVIVKYCVDPVTGERKLKTPVRFFPDMDHANAYTPDCSMESQVDTFALPKMCWIQKPGDCQEGQKCQFYFNNNNRMCEKGVGGHGFNTLTECYDTCSLTVPRCPEVEGLGTCVESCNNTTLCPEGKMCCSNGCGHVCMDPVQLVPTPCADLNCSYSEQFCLVKSNTTTMEVTGTCQAYPDHCLLGPEPGYGEAAVGTFFYFDATMRTCSKFRYTGIGGNANRFCTLAQCQAECGAREHKFRDVACPRQLVADVEIMDTCADDSQCDDEQICCPGMSKSGTKGQICTDRVNYCPSGERCSQDGYCDSEGKCVCKDCEGVAESQVCGSDGMPYPNECELKRKACTSHTIIALKHSGPCNESDTKMCPDVCPEIYEPVCAYDTTADIARETTYDNVCEMRKAQCQDSLTLAILKMGECNRTCEVDTCEVYEECIGGQCVCAETCAALYKPVCGGPEGGANMTFSSPCDLRRKGCMNQQIYVVKRPGPCIERDLPEFECPPTDPSLGASHDCNIDTNGRCDDSTEKCCPYGEGSICWPRDRLVRKVVIKDGECPKQQPGEETPADATPCEGDNDCEADAKCCTDASGSMICMAPMQMDKQGACSAGSYELWAGISCDPANNMSCPTNTTCEAQGGESRGVCCIKDGVTKPPIEEVKSKYVCSFMETFGIMCENGGTCTGNMAEGICDCPEGFFGSFCEKPKDCEGQDLINCYANPCDFAAPCEAHPEAECQANYCTGCDMMWALKDGTDVTQACVTPCMKEQAVMRAIFSKLGLRDVSPLPEPADARMVEVEATLAGGQVIEMFKKLMMRFVPFLGELHCALDGQYDSKQCVHDLRNGGAYCTCYGEGEDGNDTYLYKRQQRMTTEELDCSNTKPDFPKICLEEPSVENLCNGDTANERYYYSVKEQKCVSFTDYGCDASQNNFESLETCSATCSSTMVDPCDGNCTEDQVCRRKDGSPACINKAELSGGDGVFEPVCDADGQFEPKQCNGETCRCVNPTTGDAIPDSVAAGPNLECMRDGSGVIKVNMTKKPECPNGTKPQFCAQGGLSCQSCAESDAVKERKMKKEKNKSPDVDGQGKCKSCGSCPNNQKRKVCQQKECKKNSVCNNVPEASCVIDTCDCKEVWEFDSKPVDCNKIVSQCERKKMEVEAAKKRKEREGTDIADDTPTDVKCSPKGFESVCDKNECSCVNAQTGEKVAGGNKGRPNEELDCSKTMKQTAAKKAKFRTTLSKTKTPSQYTEAQQKKILKTMDDQVEAAAPDMQVLTSQLIAGSIIYDAEVVARANATVDIVSSVLSLQTGIENGDVAPIVVDGESFTPTDAALTEVFVEEEVVVPDDGGGDDGNKKTIIIVVVVVAAVVILAVVVGCVVMKKSKKSKQENLPFTDITGHGGKENPGYANY